MFEDRPDSSANQVIPVATAGLSKGKGLAPDHNTHPLSPSPSLINVPLPLLTFLQNRIIYLSSKKFLFPVLNSHFLILIFDKKQKKFLNEDPSFPEKVTIFSNLMIRAMLVLFYNFPSESPWLILTFSLNFFSMYLALMFTLFFFFYLNPFAFLYFLLSPLAFFLYVTYNTQVTLVLKRSFFFSCTNSIAIYFLQCTQHYNRLSPLCVCMFHLDM